MLQTMTDFNEAQPPGLETSQGLMAMNILPAKIEQFEHFGRRLQFKAGLAGSAGGRLKPHSFMGSRFSTVS